MKFNKIKIFLFILTTLTIFVLSNFINCKKPHNLKKHKLKRTNKKFFRKIITLKSSLMNWMGEVKVSGIDTKTIFDDLDPDLEVIKYEKPKFTKKKLKIQKENWNILIM